MLPLFVLSVPLRTKLYLKRRNGTGWGELGQKAWRSGTDDRLFKLDDKTAPDNTVAGLEALDGCGCGFWSVKSGFWKEKHIFWLRRSAIGRLHRFCPEEASFDDRTPFMA